MIIVVVTLRTNEVCLLSHQYFNRSIESKAFVLTNDMRAVAAGIHVTTAAAPLRHNEIVLDQRLEGTYNVTLLIGPPGIQFVFISLTLLRR